MYKKRPSRVRTIPPSRSAQITVFMILGLLVLFVFIFVLSLSTGIKKEQLQEIQEKTLTKSFKKEALRIFVEDCLTDELEDGLVLIGKQGRLWSDQPGGTRNFEEGISGIYVGEDRVFYGTIRDPYLEYENAYPCSDESSPEEFCQYSYPNTQVGFGSLELRTSTIQNDLRRYLLNKTASCVADYVKGDISSSVVLEPQEVSMDLGIYDGGIDVKVSYPLKLYLGAEEFFHLSQFDFFYPTRFKALLDTAVSLPLRMDWQYVDFGYNKTTLTSPFFTYGNEVEVEGGNCLLSTNLISENFFLCNQALFSEQYSSLAVEMSRQPLPSGDDLLVFKSSTVLNSPELYTYQFARQNRPPALDYVHRMECPAAGYDYLVIKGDQELGIINFTLSAQDPDEDVVSYYVLSSDFDNSERQNYVRKEVAERKEPYTIRTYARDEHTVQDWQDVRVLVDRPLELGVLLSMPYNFTSFNEELKMYELKSYDDIFPKGGAYLISKEDPTFVNFHFPETSLASSLYYQIITLFYENEEKTEIFETEDGPGYVLPKGIQIDGNQGCFSFPGPKTCALTNYADTINDAVWSALQKEPYGHFRKLTETGKLNLSFNANYCALFDKSKSAAIKVVVNDCVPHRNPEHPWAYNPKGNYHQYKYGLNPDGTTNFDDFKGLDPETNPFEATHSCCLGNADKPQNWAIATKVNDEPCFVNPEPGCYGEVYRDEEGIEPYTIQGRKDQLKSDDPGLVVEVQQQFCDGKRGNTCQGQVRNTLYEGKLFCGNSTFSQCRTDIPAPCQGQPAFSLIEDVGWCSGTLGCESLCAAPQSVVYTGDKESMSFPSEEINSLATKLKPGLDIKFDFQCGCTAEEQICDSNFDGKFNGRCNAENVCAGDA